MHTDLQVAQQANNIVELVGHPWRDLDGIMVPTYMAEIWFRKSTFNVESVGSVPFEHRKQRDNQSKQSASQSQGFVVFTSHSIANNSQQSQTAQFIDVLSNTK